MGHSSKKKKKRSGGGRGRGWASSKDSSCAAVVDENLLADELTVLNSIFQDDFKIISEPPHASFSIKLRPYSSDMGYDDLYVSASLLVRCLPGYPYKCPKLQIMPERGLLKEDADRLLVLLLDQAKVNAQEGRVMIFNLVEAAQEFLSEITPLSESHESIPYVSSSIKSEEATSQFDTYCYSDGSSVYSLVDLYSDLCGNDVTLSHVKKAMNGNSSKTFKIEVRQANLNNNNIYLDSHTSANPEIPVRDDSLLQNRKYEAINLIKHGDSLSASKLNVVAEEGDNDTTSSSPKATSIPMSPDTLQNINDSTKHEDMNLREQVAENDNFGSDDLFSSSSSYVSVTSDNDSQSRGKDLLLIHLLRIACSSKESLTNVLPEISLELRKIGVLSEWARDLVAAPSSEFTEAFNNAFGRQASSRFSEFWRMDSSSSKSTSRYLSDFEEVRSLGRGAFGHVALCRNKLDGRQYALKKICLKDENLHVNEKILREVATLSRLQHQHVVRYYQAWLETEYGNNNFDSAAGSRITESFSHSYLGDFNVENRNQSTYLYIQMEYCPRTLREDFDSYSSSSDKEYAWHLFRQIVEGLAHIHSQGIIHRDLTPSNIFFDVRNEIKIGDFGLAKFLQLEQLDHDQHFPAEMTGMSTDGTGRVGTYFYTAPEVEMSWPQINEKADMYSLGVIFFELWHPFATAMERHIVLSDLKQKSLVPPSWAAKFPREATLLQRLISLSPSDRPSATELLQHELPPRLEDEWLNEILRTIESSEDTYVYDRVVSTIFDEGRLISKYHNKQSGHTLMTGDDHCIMPHTQFGTGFQDTVIAVSKEIFRQHCAKRFDISPLRILDESSTFNRKSIKLLAQGGNILELCHELRSPFVNWVVMNQKLFCKRYEISWVYRRAIGHSTPSHFLQGDFDIIGGALSLTEAEVIKVALDIAMHFFPSTAMQIHLNHSQILESIWSWVGIPHELRQNVAELISIIGSSYPQSSHRKLSWNFIRRQLLQDLNVSEALVNRLQLADLRFCGPADQALARLRGALSPDKSTLQALEDMSALLRYLRFWNIEQNISIDVLMPPTETYYQSLFFQIYLKESGSRSSEATLLAIGGRYDRLIQQTWESAYRSVSPGAVGVSFALEKILLLSSVEIMPSRYEPNTHVLVCSRGGGGLLQERMELVAEFWEANIKAEFLPQKDPSFKEQYEYASENDIKCLVIITEAGLSQGSLVKVRHLEFKKEKEVEREEIVKFLTDSISTQFRNHTFWT
ncbi:eIF-2-alpha kinase GCN2 isoform X2 [Zingiber officinale]|uniref:eIF-2-alpha kinase GCN2 isoform X2 n=1 Tax=Zingiber officinale TaxID=94328 RepID=UPI001C4C9627|nr:eIF-2-alpha kinase GCN2 isoform X2 [Zingiber officinale]